MQPFIEKRSKKSGLPPGSLVFLGEKKIEKLKITLFSFDNSDFEEKEIKNIEECFPYKTSSKTTWINIEGLNDVNLLEKLGKQFDIHPLALEDILNTYQRPKKEDFEKNIFIVLKMLDISFKNEIVSEQVSIILGQNYVITFQEGIEGDVFNPIRERIRNNKGNIRSSGTDYLTYSLLDSIVDRYFLILEKLGEKIEIIEASVIKTTTSKNLQEVHKAKQELIFLRRSVWPLREVIVSLQRDSSPLMKDACKIYLRDLYDHTIHIMENIDSLREMITSITEIYLSNLSNKLNETIRVLTIISTLFIPPTFIVGIYGMNFQNMPELGWRWGYPVVMVFMIVVSIGMFFFFRKRKWI